MKNILPETGQSHPAITQNKKEKKRKEKKTGVWPKSGDQHADDLSRLSEVPWDDGMEEKFYSSSLPGGHTSHSTDPDVCVREDAAVSGQ